jgi:TrmH family RNA methyltransferase
MPSEIITSTKNTLVQAALDLREAKVRRGSGLTVIDGVRELSRTLDADVEIKHVFYCPKLLVDAGEELLTRLHAKKKYIIEVNEFVFSKIAFGDRQEGVIGVVRVPQLKLEGIRLSKKPLVVIVESVEKPGNLGAIMRSCDAVGVEALLICDPKTDVYNPNVIRSSTGVVFHLPIVTLEREKILEFLRARKIKICATVVDAKQSYTSTDLSEAIAIALGTEDQGLSDFWIKNADIKVKIPMKGIADSLNVSTSAAIMLYEAFRQRST